LTILLNVAQEARNQPGNLPPVQLTWERRLKILHDVAVRALLFRVLGFRV
jgi:hypothetical protein